MYREDYQPFKKPEIETPAKPRAARFVWRIAAPPR
jgi:hypothetical protein